MSQLSAVFWSGLLVWKYICCFFSINCFDVDENDTRHMVLCRVIMGNMEVVHPGSNQFHPSSEDFDTGVDRLENPNDYVVWNMNMNSHVYPEYAVSFKMTSDVEGNSWSCT